MKILIVGSGGREHAMAFKAAQSDRIDVVYVAPGNGGTEQEAKVQNVDIAATDIPALLNFVHEASIDLTIVGPEAPLVAGIADAFNDEGLRCFGPEKAASQLEGSKAFAKRFMQQHAIPTAAYECFTDLLAAKSYVDSAKYPLVLKADGLAAGKGVVIVNNPEEAKSELDGLMAGKRFGEASQTVVIEQFLEGTEASFMIVTDGTHWSPLATSQDHKRRDAGDKGPNTGGMGAFSPSPIVDAARFDRIANEVVEPTLQGLREEGLRYCGFLYFGLMINPSGDINVLEYNCRLGDPETQPILMRLQSDFVDLCIATIENRLDKIELKWDSRPAVGIVMASGGYPDKAETGFSITGLENLDRSPELKVFHAGTKFVDGKVVTAGGRVLCVTALGHDIQEASHLAYTGARQISWPGCFVREDIGNR